MNLKEIYIYFLHSWEVWVKVLAYCREKLQSLTKGDTFNFQRLPDNLRELSYNVMLSSDFHPPPTSLF